MDTRVMQMAFSGILDTHNGEWALTGSSSRETNWKMLHTPAEVSLSGDSVQIITPGRFAKK